MTTTTTLRDYVNQYATTRSLAPATAQQYEIAVARFEEFAGDGIRLEQLDEMQLSAWLQAYAENAKPATVRSKRNAILALWRAAADDFLCEPPRRRVRMARVPWKPPVCWSLEEVRQLIRTASTMPRWHRCGLRRREWWPLAIRLAWDTGLRWGDLVRLRFDDIHDGVVVVTQRKTRLPQVSRLQPSTVQAVEASRESCPRDAVVAWTASHETFNKQVRLLVSKAGVRPGTWKWLRRGGATDVEIQEPGRGASSRHLGHRPGSNIAPMHYLDPTLLSKVVPITTPRDLGECA